MTTLDQLAMYKQKDIEKLFAGSAHLYPLETIQTCGWLKPETILDERIKKYWKGIISRVTSTMTKEDIEKEIIQIAFENDLIFDIADWNGMTLWHNPLPYANEINRRYYLTNLAAQVGQLVQTIQQGDDTQAREIIRKMSEMELTQKDELPDAFDVAAEFDRLINTGSRSISTFLPPLDRAIGGLERQSLTILAARPSTGKTALSWQIARATAYNGKKSIFYTLEMSAANVWARAACPQVGTTWRDVRAGLLTDEQLQRLTDESYKLAANFDGRLKIIGKGQSTDTIWKTIAQHRPDLIVIDHLRLLKDAHISEVKRLGNITQRLKDIAVNFDCAVLLDAQLSRKSENRPNDDKRPILADLRDSGEIEENADLVLMMHRDAVDFEKPPEKSITEIWTRKFRDGPRDQLIKLWFDAKQEWFSEVTR